MRHTIAVVSGLLLASGCCDCGVYSAVVFHKSDAPFIDGVYTLKITFDGQTRLCQVDSSVHPETVDCDGSDLEISFSQDLVLLALSDKEPGVAVSVEITDQVTTWQGSLVADQRKSAGDACACEYGFGETDLVLVE
ncbi:MAG: hypothetical protein KC457_16990 [Myxococcales bacterium]|nr:hypothetical protein [Myxococcales bacterium]